MLVIKIAVKDLLVIGFLMIPIAALLAWFAYLIFGSLIQLEGASFDDYFRKVYITVMVAVALYHAFNIVLFYVGASANIVKWQTTFAKYEDAKINLNLFKNMTFQEIMDITPESFELRYQSAKRWQLSDQREKSKQ